MEGRTISHYEVLARIDRGGMGVVYKARDTRLDRTVALKFLSPGLLSSVEARERFLAEARAASALDHPNICTVHEIGDAGDGQLFIVMAHYEGETVRQRLARGRLDQNDALDIALQAARGLAAAHQRGIVHRDIKPANLMITADGTVKILDFGLAKDDDGNALTQTGDVVGTVAYMAPEQLEGRNAGPQSDIWALGAVLYEMLTGRHPFQSDSGSSVVAAILNSAVTPADRIVPEVGEPASAVAARCLAKRMENRFASAADLVSALSALRPISASSAGRPRPLDVRRRPVATIVAAAATVGIVGFVFVEWNRNADGRWARDEAIPAIEAFIDAGEWEAAFDIAVEVDRRVPGQPDLAELWPSFSATRTIESDPPGARVFRRPYASDEGWEEVGTTPIAARIPGGVSELRFELDGYRPLVRAYAPTGGRGDAPFVLDTEDSLPDNKVRVPGWEAEIDGVNVVFEDFFLGRHEVTNSEYQEFVDAGGYARPEFWEHEIVVDGEPLQWEEAITLFTDQSGRPGPATWLVGHHPEGEEDHPVGGVSWYEAMAYASFVGEELPTFYHWQRAYPPAHLGWLVPQSNVDSGQAAAVGQSGVNWVGAFDMVGNVREWLSTESGVGYMIRGSDWDLGQSIDLGSRAGVRNPLDRHPSNGLRLAILRDNEPVRTLAETPIRPEPSTRRETVSPETFAAYRSMYAYDSAPLNAEEEPGVAVRYAVRHRIAFDAAYDDRMVLYLYLPENARPPYQTVIYWPAGTPLSLQSIDQYPMHNLDWILKSGRALAAPVFNGTFERDCCGVFPAPESLALRDAYIEWVQDVQRTLDYLETRPDLDANGFSFYGRSWGSVAAPLLLAIEPRFQAAVITNVGILSDGRRPEVDPWYFLPDVKLPLLMFSGLLDSERPYETSVLPFIDRLGTSEREFVEGSTGTHVTPVDRVTLISKSLAWLDRHVGVPQ